MGGAREIVPLNEGWQYHSASDPDGDLSTWQPARPLPTTIHMDLLAAGRIPDPFQGKNEELIQWVGQKAWSYQHVFTVPEQWTQDADRRVVLVCEGLDTVATVSLDGKVIHEARNMFVAHRIDITEHIRRGSQQAQHTLQITFHVIEAEGEKEVQKYPEHNWKVFSSGISRLAMRKAQYQFGWDWGPKLLDCGPWKPIYLETYTARVVETSIQTKLARDHSHADIDIRVDVEGGATYAGVALEIDGVRIDSSLLEVKNAICSARLVVQNPQLWWPFTLGKQPLYKAKVRLMTESSGSSITLDTVEKTFGIRQIELVQEPLQDEEGSSFYFRINKVPIFAAGSCWIPTDSMLARITPQKYRDLVSLARQSNQVMIRVWGGGIYEHDAFYEACDQQGILVWQDFMFACGIFPAHAEFQESVKLEATQNIKRLRDHPSIALWCGNNEDYIIPLFSGSEYDPDDKDISSIMQSEFPARAFYEHIFPALCQSLTPDTPYWPGSPFGGDFVNSTTEGDVHQWHVWHLEKFPYQQYPELSGRFISEFGMEAAPSLSTARKFFPADPRREKLQPISNEHMVWHNKCGEGAEILETYCTSNINFNQDSLESYIYGTQLIQSEAVSTAYRSWRRLWQGPSRQNCGGALVWQLNDCWPVTSWAIIDSDLNPKMAFWAVKRENAAITAGLSRKVQDDGSARLEAWACNMTLRSETVNVEVKAWDARTGRSICKIPLCTEQILKSNQATELGGVDMSQYVAGSSLKSEELVWAIYLLPTTSTEGGQSIIARHVNFHEPLKDVPLSSDLNGLTISLSRAAFESSQAILELESRVPMKGVFLEFQDNPQVVLDDNCVDLVPGDILRIGVTGLTPAVHQVTASWLDDNGWQSRLESIAPHKGYKV